MSSKSGPAMIDVTPAPPSQPKTKRRSIKTKFLVALLVLSLLPLILFVAITRSVLLDARDDVKAALMRQAHREISLQDKNQATIATAMFAQVEAETQMAAFFAQALLRDPAAFGHTRSYSANEKPEDIAAADQIYSGARRLFGCRPTRTGPDQQSGRTIRPDRERRSKPEEYLCRHAIRRFPAVSLGR